MRGSVFPTCQFSLESDMFLLSYDDLGINMPACTVSFHLIGKIMCQVGSIYFWLDMCTCISCVGDGVNMPFGRFRLVTHFIGMLTLFHP